MIGRLTAALHARRRLGGAVLLLAGIAVALVVVWPSGGDDAAGARTTTTAKRLPIRIVSAPALGLGFAHPTSWTRTVEGSVFTLTSPDRSIRLVVSSPLDRPARDAAKAAAEQALLQRLAPAKVVRDGPGSLGGRSVASFELRGSDHDEPVRALVLVASTDYRTYAVTLLTGAHPSKRRLTEARRILATVRFGKPVAARR